MKKTMLLVVLFVPITLFAPNINYVNIVEEEAFNYHHMIADAVCMVESGFNSLAYNEVEQAVGAFQIRPIRVEDYNKRTGNNYKLEDFYDISLSRECFLYYASLYDDAETIVRRWNGSGEMTIIYWNKVKKYL